MRKGIVTSLTLAGAMTLGVFNVGAEDHQKQSRSYMSAVLLGTDSSGIKGSFKSITDIRAVSSLTFTVKADSEAAQKALNGEISITGTLGTQTSSGTVTHEWSFTPYKTDENGEVLYDDDTLLPISDREVTFEKINDDFYTATIDEPQGFFGDDDAFASVWFDCDNDDYDITLSGIVLSFDDSQMTKDVKNCTVTLSTANYTYNGSAKKPAAVVKYGSKTLKEGTDYTLTYASNVNAGTASVTVKGIGKYKGTKKSTFTISPVPMSAVTVSLPKTSYAYTGKSISPVVYAMLGSKVLTSGTDYKVSYSANTAIGTATVKITGKGNYTGTVSKTYKIVPAATTLKSVTSAAAKKAAVKWNKNSNCDGYQIMYSTSSSFSSKSYKNIGSGTQVSTALTNLTSGRTYYVRIRAFKKVNGTKVYGAYSASKAVKVK